MKKASEVFNSIRFAKGELRGKEHMSTDDEEHYAVGEKEFGQQLQHAKKRAMQEGDEHYNAGAEKMKHHIGDEHLKDNARETRKYVLKQNPHKKGTQEHKDWKHGAEQEAEYHIDSLEEEKKDVYDEGEYDQEGDMAKSDLRSIIANAKRMHDMIEDSDNLPEWVQSKITKAEDYISTVANYMEAEMNEEVEQIDEISSDLVKKARDVAFAKGKEDQAHRFVRKAYQKGQKESEAMAKKINEVSNALLQRYKEKAGKQIDNPATPSATKLKRGVGHLKATSKQMTSGKPMPEEVEMQEEMDYNVKVSHTTADGKNVDKVYKVAKAKDHRHAQNIALNKHTDALDKAGTKFTRATATVVREDVETLEEKNVPTSPEKWARAKAMAKSKFDVYPSAYANGWAAKKYKEMGGGWKSVSEATEKPPFEGGHKPEKKAIAGKYGAGYSTARHLARMAMKRQADKMKTPVKEEASTKAKIVKAAAKKTSEDKFQAEPEMSTTMTKNV